MKKFCSILMALIVTMMSVVYASAASVEKTLSLDEAIKMAVEDNPQFISADTKIKDAERQLAEAKKDQKDVVGPIRIPAGISLAFVKKGYYVEQAAIGVESAKREKIKAENVMAYEVTQKYYSVKLAEALYGNTVEANKLAVENKKAIDKNFELGLVSKLDVDNANYAVMQTEAACSKYKRNLSLATENLKIALQIDEQDVALVLTDGIEYEPFEANLAEDIEKAMTTRFDVYSLQSVCNQAKEYLKTMELLLGVKSSEYSAANQSLVQSEYTYTNTKKLIGLAIKSSYNDILNAEDSLKLAEENLNLKKQEYQIAKVQHDIGMITNTQLTGALNAIASAEIEFENAKLTYKLAVEKYGY